MDILGLIQVDVVVTGWGNVSQVVVKEDFSSADGTCSAGRIVSYLPSGICLPLATLAGSQSMTCAKDGSDKILYNAYTSNDCTGVVNALGGNKSLDTCATFATDYSFSGCVSDVPNPTKLPTRRPTTLPDSAAPAARVFRSIGDVALIALSAALAAGLLTY
jgi:hypothetical protein